MQADGGACLAGSGLDKITDLVVEWIGAPKAGVDSPSPSDFGSIAASGLGTVTWEGWQLRVPPLDPPD